jgi:hypothetical protein
MGRAWRAGWPYIPRTAHLLHHHSDTPPLSQLMHPQITASSSLFQLISSCQDFTCHQNILGHFMPVVKRAHPPVAMPSSPKATSSTRQAARVSKHSSSSDRLRQTVYDDGRSRCIVESRRRSQMVRDIEPNHIEHSSVWSIPYSDMMETPSRPHLGRSQSPCSASSSMRSPRGGLAPSRDEDAKPLSSKTKPVVIVPASFGTIELSDAKRNGTSQHWIEPTPPPTPRLRRLSTPELSDLGDVPFCECDEVVLRRYCTSCRKDVDPLTKWN